MTSGFTKVISVAGAVVATLLVLAILGAVNQHDKLTSMTAVVDGFTDVLGWIGELLSLAVSKL